MHYKFYMNQQTPPTDKVFKYIKAYLNQMQNLEKWKTMHYSQLLNESNEMFAGFNMIFAGNFVWLLHIGNIYHYMVMLLLFANIMA